MTTSATVDVDTLVVGAGQAGLALSRCLTERGHEHVLLERGRIAERWRSERWDSFRLLTPNYQTRLPGFRYTGDDPDGFMGRDEVVRFFDEYAASFDPPVETGVTVERVTPFGERWQVVTSRDTYAARRVVVATGHYGVPRAPDVAAQLPGRITRLFARDYRNPRALPPGGVLVVGAGPSGQQIADELARAGRTVFLSAGTHRPLPRSYRGVDTYRWMERMGALHRTVDTLDDPAAAARAPSAVLAGERDDLDLRRVVRNGVRPLGRLVGADSARLRLAGDLPRTLAAADAHTARFRAQVDEFVARTGLSVPGENRPPTAPPRWALDAPTELDLRAEGVSTVIWATGYRRDFSWVQAPVLDASGEPVQRRGFTAAPGLMFLGLRFMYRRNSNFIDGVGADAEHLAAAICGATGTDRNASVGAVA